MGQRKPWKKGRPSISRLMESRTTYMESISDLVGSSCVASCGDWWVIVKSPCKRECLLWNYTSCQKLQLPQMPKNSPTFSKCILSAPPTEPQCAVLFFYKEIPDILCCKVGDTQWTTFEYSDNPELIYPDAISCNGKIYVLHYRGVLSEIVIQPNGLKREFIESQQVPRIPAEKQHLVDSCGEVFLVQRFSVSKLEVFSMDFSRNEWVKIQNLGDRVFFLNCHYSVSLSVVELGIQGNCIYFAEDDDESLYVYHFGDESLSVSLHGPNSRALWFSHDGLMPVLRLFNKPKCELKEEEEEEEINDTKEVSKVEDDEAEKHVFFNLPMDVHESIAKCVSVGRDYMNFRAVCRSWRSLAPPCPCQWSYDDSASSTTIPYPWLMLFQIEKSRCTFCDPRDNVTYHMNITELSPYCVIRFAMEGWLLVSQGARSIFLFEPFSMTRIQLLDPPVDYCFNSICFSASPMSSTCVIFGILHKSPECVGIFWLPPTREYWSSTYCDNDRPFRPSWNNLVFLDGLFFCLGQDGSLGVFELKGTEFTWKILRKPLQLIFPSSVCRSFLVSFDEELIPVFVGNLGKWVHVYKLDNLKCEWVKVGSLGNRMLCVGQTTSLAVIAEEETMKNKISSAKLTARTYVILWKLACSRHLRIAFMIQKNIYIVPGFSLSWFQLSDGLMEYFQVKWVKTMFSVFKNRKMITIQLIPI